MTKIRVQKDIERFLAQLVILDPRLGPIAEIAGPLPLRLSTPDFAGLADIVVSQHISKTSAAAILKRLTHAVNPLTATQWVATSDQAFVDVGLTRAKTQTLSGLATAVIDQDLDLASLGDLPHQEAVTRLTAFKGVGPWTAEVFLLFCAGHIDIFPAGDVALRTAIGHAFQIDPRPSIAAVNKFAQQWMPLRGIAARLFWGYYAATNSCKEN